MTTIAYRLSNHPGSRTLDSLPDNWIVEYVDNDIGTFAPEDGWLTLSDSDFATLLASSNDDGYLASVLADRHAAQIAAQAAIYRIPNPFNLSSDITLSDGYNLILVDTNASRTITLYSNPAVGKIITIKDVIGLANTNPITIARAGSEYIEVIQSNKILNSNYGVWKLMADSNGNWFIIT